MKLSVRFLVLSVVVVLLVGSVTPKEVDFGPEVPTELSNTIYEPSDDVKHLLMEENENKLATVGYDLFPGQIPYHAEVGVKTKGSSGLHIRAGTLVTPSFVLMPAYFLGNMLFNYEFDYGEIGLGAGFGDGTQWEQRINFTMNGIRFHPLYRYPSTELNNIALIRMEHPATVSTFVKPIRLPAASDDRTFELMEGTTIGAYVSNDPKYARNEVMENAKCMAGRPSEVADQHLCTNPYIGGSFCNIQYGSSLAIEDETGPVLVGTGVLVHYCTFTNPNQFVRVSFFRDWIQMNSDYED
uniref:Peptidase S1 domain-containing protein n=1 Tax=Anopheles epiroticus TaxID=199890 RepID=A0A182P0P8_9DIPT